MNKRDRLKMFVSNCLGSGYWLSIENILTFEDGSPAVDADVDREIKNMLKSLDSLIDEAREVKQGIEQEVLYG